MGFLFAKRSIEASMNLKVLCINCDDNKRSTIYEWFKVNNTVFKLWLDQVQVNDSSMLKILQMNGVQGYSLIVIEDEKLSINAIEQLCKDAANTVVLSNIRLIGSSCINFGSFADKDFKQVLVEFQNDILLSGHVLNDVMKLDMDTLRTEGNYVTNTYTQSDFELGNAPQNTSASNEDDLAFDDVESDSVSVDPLAASLNGNPALFFGNGGEMNNGENEFTFEIETEGAPAATSSFSEVAEEPTKEMNFAEDDSNNNGASDGAAKVQSSNTAPVNDERETAEQFYGNSEQLPIPEDGSETVNASNEGENDTVKVVSEDIEVVEQSETVTDASGLVANDGDMNNLKLHDFTRAIQKRLVNQKWNRHKTVAVWSPIGRMGVTTFCINFACFLAENRMYTSVLEGVRSNVMLRHTLKRYMKQPENWKSYASCIRETKVDENGNVTLDPQSVEVEWEYKDVKFIPLDDGDISLKWSQEMLQVYLTMPQLMDVTVIDLPSGEMSDISYATLVHVDTLLVLVDDAFQETIAWKDYILYLRDYFDIEIQLVFNKAYPFSDVKMLQSQMELNVLATIPALHQQVMENYYHNRPILYNKLARAEMFPAFTVMAKHILGDEFKLYTTAESAKSAFDLSTLRRFSPKILQRLFALLKPRK